jgi:hypothetical protein
MDQEKICRWCEDNIIGGSSMTQMFQCEGRFCEQAEQDIKDQYYFYPSELEIDKPKKFVLNGNSKSISSSAN